MNALAWLTSLRDRYAAERQISALRQELARSRVEVRELNSKVETLLDQKASLQEELESQRVTNRIQQLEVDLMTAVCARNQIRVERENGAAQ